jgi:hypothetical protein
MQKDICTGLIAVQARHLVRVRASIARPLHHPLKIRNFQGKGKERTASVVCDQSPPDEAIRSKKGTVSQALRSVRRMVRRQQGSGSFSAEVIVPMTVIGVVTE